MAGDEGGGAVKPRAMGASAAFISFATMCSRLLGLVREQVLAAMFGSGMHADAFFVAFRFPNLFRDLFAEGILSSAFVPTFTEHLRSQGREGAFRLANAVIGLVLLVVGAVTLLGIAFAPQLVAVVAHGFDPAKQDLTTLCTRILFPFLPLLSLAAVVMGQLNAQERYGPPAFAPMCFNLVAVAGGAYLLAVDAPPESAVAMWSVAMLAAGLSQLLVQLPALFRTGYRPRLSLNWRLPGVQRIGRLMAPATVGLAATHVNILVSTWFASQQDGAMSWLNYAFRLIWLPIGVFGVALGTVATTRLAMGAAAQDRRQMAATLSEGLRLVAFLTVPSTVGLIVLREPVVRLIYERRVFTAADTSATAWAVLLYALGMCAYSAIKVMAPAFYALDRPRAAVAASIGSMGVNVTVAVALFPAWGFKALALGTSVAAMANVVVLWLAFQRLVGGLDLRAMAGHFARVILASLVSGGAALATWRGTEAVLGEQGLAARGTVVVLAVGAGMAAYAAAAKALDLAELDALTSGLRRRFVR